MEMRGKTMDEVEEWIRENGRRLTEDDILRSIDIVLALYGTSREKLDDCGFRDTIFGGDLASGAGKLLRNYRRSGVTLIEAEKVDETGTHKFYIAVRDN